MSAPFPKQSKKKAKKKKKKKKNRHFWSTREAKVGTTDCQPPAHLDAEGESELSEKEIIFIRHGESQWNEIFNRGKLFLLPRLLINIIVEMFSLPFKVCIVFIYFLYLQTHCSVERELWHSVIRILYRLRTNKNKSMSEYVKVKFVDSFYLNKDTQQTNRVNQSFLIPLSDQLADSNVTTWRMPFEQTVF